MGRSDRDLFLKAEELFKAQGYITKAHLVKHLDLSLDKASKIYKALKDYCLAETLCIEYKNTLYYLKDSEELKRILQEYKLRLKTRDLRYLVYSVMKLLEQQNPNTPCIQLQVLIREVKRRQKYLHPTF